MADAYVRSPRRYGAIRIAQWHRARRGVLTNRQHLRTWRIEPPLGLPVRLQPVPPYQLAQVSGRLPRAQSLVGLIRPTAHPTAHEDLIERGDTARRQPLGIDPLLQEHPDIRGLAQPTLDPLCLHVMRPQREPDPRPHLGALGSPALLVPPRR